MTRERRELTRADLPAEFTSETIRRLPMSTLRRLGSPGNGILDSEEQAQFDAVLREVMSETAGRVSRHITRADWAAARGDTEGDRARRGRGPGRTSSTDRHLERLARRIDRQVDAAEALAPGVDWSFAQPSGSARPVPSDEADDTADDVETVDDLEERLTEQVELVQVMSEIAEVSKRTYALERQRDLQTTRGVFFGFVVSIAVLFAGWAPIVAADDWAERLWIFGLTLGTCVIAGGVYAFVRMRERRQESELDDEQPAD